ncbi:MAG: hypothetical protein FWC55_02930 [Firmicutes bacterium]|nr:hypothetical protein [Bacillota bacterium]
MTTLQECNALLDTLSEGQLLLIRKIIESIREVEDDVFCVNLYDQAIAENDDERVSSEDLRAGYGL